jgi:hypothetical protein
MAFATGTALTTPPFVLINTANAITKKKYHPNMVDQYGRPSTLYWWLTRKSRRFGGGGSLVVPLAFSEPTAGGAYAGAMPLPGNLEDTGAPAEAQWRFYQQTIPLPVTDALLNEGEGRHISLQLFQENQAMIGLLQKLARGIFGIAPQNTALDFDSILAAMAAAGGTYLGVTLGAPWLCNGGNGPTTMAAAPNSTGAALNLAGMDGVFGQATWGNESPDGIFTTQNGFSSFKGLLIGNQIYQTDNEAQNAGFANVLFNFTPIFRDQWIPAGDMTMLNSKYVELWFKNNDYFTRDPWIMPSLQRVLYSHIYVTGDLIVTAPRMIALITTITNA